MHCTHTDIYRHNESGDDLLIFVKSKSDYLCTCIVQLWVFMNIRSRSDMHCTQLIFIYTMIVAIIY